MSNIVNQYILESAEVVLRRASTPADIETRLEGASLYIEAGDKVALAKRLGESCYSSSRDYDLLVGAAVAAYVEGNRTSQDVADLFDIPVGLVEAALGAKS